MYKRKTYKLTNSSHTDVVDRTHEHKTGGERTKPTDEEGRGDGGAEEKKSVLRFELMTTITALKDPPGES